MELKDYHTKRLLVELSAARKCRSNQAIYDVPDYYDAEHPFSIEDIKAELATREHIPNKKEARKIRQERAKTRRR